MTPAVLAHINDTYNRDPAFANLMHLAGASKATPEQLRALGTYIQTLARDVPTPNQNPSSDQGSSTHVAPIRSFASPPDLIIEFSENRNDRWLLPKDSKICDSQIYPGTADADISLLLKLTPQRRLPDSDSSEKTKCGVDDQSAILNFHRTSASIKSVISSRFTRAALQPVSLI